MAVQCTFYLRVMEAGLVCAVCNRAVNPNPEPEWSGAHKGLALYISRLLAPIWDMKLITPSAKSANVWRARLSDITMTVR